MAITKNSHVYMLMGGMTGTAVDLYLPGVNTGMYGLRDRLVAAGFSVTVYPWGQRQAAERDMAAFKASGGVVIVIGFSGGASCVTWMGARIDLLIGYDPSPAGQVKKLGANVAKAYCYHNLHPAMWWPGVGWLGGGQYIGQQVTTFDVSEFHLAVQYDQALHARTMAACRELVA